VPHYRPSFSENLNLTQTLWSFALEVPMGSIIAYAVRATGAPTGTLIVQYSNDFIPGFQAGNFPAGDNPASDAKWDTFPITVTPPAFAGAPLTFPIQCSSPSTPFYPFKFVRLKYTFTSGSGNLFYACQIKG
jgi:hypothetical protein